MNTYKHIKSKIIRQEVERYENITEYYMDNTWRAPERAWMVDHRIGLVYNGYRYTGGLELAISNALWGLLLCVTIIGIPFGLQFFKIAKVALMPFGAIVEREHVF